MFLYDYNKVKNTGVGVVCPTCSFFERISLARRSNFAAGNRNESASTVLFFDNIPDKIR